MATKKEIARLKREKKKAKKIYRDAERAEQEASEAYYDARNAYLDATENFKRGDVLEETYRRGISRDSPVRKRHCVIVAYRTYGGHRNRVVKKDGTLGKKGHSLNVHEPNCRVVGRVVDGKVVWNEGEGPRAK